MPYIKSTDRLRLARGGKATSAGELNYLLTKRVTEFLGQSEYDLGTLEGDFKNLIYEYCENVGFKYQTANDVVGALVCAKMELTRRAKSIFSKMEIDLIGNSLDLILQDFYKDVISPYEDMKIKENGDVYNSL